MPFREVAACDTGSSAASAAHVRQSFGTAQVEGDVRGDERVTPLAVETLDRRAGEEASALSATRVTKPEPVDFSAQFRTVFEARSFETIAQTAIDKYYKIPYPGEAPKKVNRRLHGGVHASRATINVDMFVDFYRRFAPELLVHPDGSPLSDEDIQLIKLAALYHDSANISETETRRIPGRGKEAAHAEQFITDMVALGFPRERVEAIAWGIEGKDAPHGEKNIYQKLVHDADCIEYMRLLFRADTFKRENLDIFRDLCSIAEFKGDLGVVLNDYFEWMQQFKGKESRIGELHIDCEKASDCYLATYNTLKDRFLTALVLRATEQGKLIHIDDIDWSRLSPLDLHLRNEEAMDHLIVSLPDRRSDAHPSIEELLSKGCFLRAVGMPQSFSGRFEEAEVLESNREILRQHGINTPEQFREFMRAQAGKVFTPVGADGTPFKWRPSTYIRRGYSPALICGRGGGLAVAMNPEAEGTLVPYSYKKNAASRTAVVGDFIYEPRRGSLKSRGSVSEHRAKMMEMQRRVDGWEEDPGLHYLGERLHHNESLAHYVASEIPTIILTKSDPETAKKALLLRAKYGATFTTFALYSFEEGLTPLSEEDLLAMTIPSPVEEVPEERDDIPSKPISERVIEMSTEKFGNAEAIKLMEMPEEMTPTGKKYLGNILTKKIRISFNKQSLSPQALRRVRELLLTRVVPRPADFGDWDMPIEVKVLEDGESISIEYDFFFHAEYTKRAAHTELEKFVKAIEPVLDGRGDQPLSHFDLARNLRLPESVEVECLSKGTPLSSSNPLRFAFAYPGNTSVRCVVRREGGRELVDFHLDDGRVISGPVEKPLMRDVALSYYNQQIGRLNTNLNEQEVKERLGLGEAEEITFHLVRKGSKSVLAIACKLTPEADQEAVQTVLVRFLETLSADPRKLYQMHASIPELGEPQANTLYITSPHVMGVDRLADLATA